MSVPTWDRPHLAGANCVAQGAITPDGRLNSLRAMGSTLEPALLRAVPRTMSSSDLMPVALTDDLLDRPKGPLGRPKKGHDAESMKADAYIVPPQAEKREVNELFKPENLEH